MAWAERIVSMGVTDHAVVARYGRSDCRLSRVLRGVRGAGAGGDSHRRCLPLDVGAEYLLPGSSSCDDRDRCGRGAGWRSLPLDDLGEATPGAGRTGHVSGRLPRLLGAPVDLLPGRALGLHSDLRDLRAGGRGRLGAGAAAAARRQSTRPEQTSPTACTLMLRDARSTATGR